MRRQELSGSRLPLAELCQGAFVLEAFERVGGEAAARGRVAHAFIDRSMKDGAKLALDAAPAVHRDWLSSIDLEALATFLGGHPSTEVPVAWNWLDDVGLMLSPMQERNYNVEAMTGWIPGTADAVHVEVDPDSRTVLIKLADWKTGFTWPLAPEENRQIHLYALALGRVAQERYAGYAVTVDGMIVRIDEDGDALLLRHRFDEVELDGIASALRRICGDIVGARSNYDASDGATRPRFRTGPHCAYCDCFASCPAQIGTALALSRTDIELAAVGGVGMTPERAGQAWEVVRAAEVAVDRCKAALREMAVHAPLALPSGKILREIPTKREVLSPMVLRTVLDEMGFGLAFGQAARVTKEGLSRALPDKSVTKEVLGRMRDLGGIRILPETRVREVGKNWKPKED